MGYFSSSRRASRKAKRVTRRSARRSSTSTSSKSIPSTSRPSVRSVDVGSKSSGGGRVGSATVYGDRVGSGKTIVGRVSSGGGGTAPVKITGQTVTKISEAEAKPIETKQAIAKQQAIAPTQKRRSPSATTPTPHSYSATARTDPLNDKIGLGTALRISGANVVGAIKGDRKWKGSLSSIQGVGKRKGEINEYILTKEGDLVDASHLTNFQKKQYEKFGGKALTYDEVKKLEKEKLDPTVQKYAGMRTEDQAGALASDIVSKVAKEYQKKIDSGKLLATNKEELKVVQAQADVEVQKRFESQSPALQDYNKRIAKYDLENLGERQGAVALRKAPAVLETAGLVGLSLTGPQGVVLAGGIIASKGTIRATRTLANEDLTTGQKIKGLSLAGVEVGLGVGGMGSGFKAVEKQIVSGEFKALSSKKWDFTEVRKTGNKIEPFSLTAKRQSGMLSQDLTMKGNVIKVGDKKYFISRTSATVETSGELSWNILNAKGGSKVIDLKTFNVAGSGYSIPTGKGSSFSMGQTLTKPVAEMGTIFKGGTNPLKLSTRLGKSFKLINEAPTIDVVGGTSKLKSPIKNVAYPEGTKFYASKGFNIKGFNIDTTGGGSLNIISKQTAKGTTLLVPKSSTGVGEGLVTIQKGSGFGSSGGSLGTTQVSQSLFGTQVSSSLSKVTPTITQTKGFVAPIVISAKTKTISSSKTKPTLTTKLSQEVSPKLDTSPVIVSKSAITFGSGSKSSTSSSTTQINIVSPKLKVTPSLVSSLASSTAQVTKQSQKLTFGSTPPTSRNFDMNIRPPTINPKIPFFLPPSLGGGFGFGKSKKVGGIRKYSYAPSFKAMMFNIKSSKATPKASKKWTGLETRPITEGFTFFKKRKKKKKKKRTNILNGFSFKT